jgi:hypothetical protein
MQKHFCYKIFEARLISPSGAIIPDEIWWENHYVGDTASAT